MWSWRRGEVLVQLWWGRTTCLQKVKQYRQCLLSFLDGSRQYSSCDSVSITVLHTVWDYYWHNWLHLITPRAHARSGVKQSVLSVSQSVSQSSVSQSSVSQSSVRWKKLKSRHIDPQKTSKWSQTIVNSKKLLYVYLTEVKALRFAVFRLFPTFHNYS